MSFVFGNREASRIFQAIFRDRAHGAVIQRFQQIAPTLSQSFSAAEQQCTERILAANGDLEAIELAGRLTRRTRLLSAQFRLMVLLAECEPEFRAALVNQRPGRIRALWALLRGVAFSAYKLVKGLVLLSRLSRLESRLESRWEQTRSNGRSHDV